MLKEAIDASLDHLNDWMSWVKNEPEPLHHKEQRCLAYQHNFENNKQYVYGIFSPDESILI
jgi:hypothetical protein